MALPDYPTQPSRAPEVLPFVGQLLMVGFEGTAPPPYLLEWIEEGRAGGVILFGRNLESPEQVAGAITRLQEAAARGPAGRLLVAVDQEGGAVTRLGAPCTVFPGNMALGATGSTELAYRAARAMAREMAALGINFNFAPVVDVNNNPQNPIIGLRSYGEDPRLVAELGAAQIRGFQEGGVLACAKHFPGHGDTAIDSHLDLPVVPHDRAHLARVELVPFRRAVEAGVAAVMTAHVAFPALEPEPGRPATLSRSVLSGLLREKLGFAGLLVTDCLEMGAISRRYRVGDAAVHAVEAGADIVLISHRPDRQAEAHEALVDAVRTGRLAPQSIARSLGRIAAARQRAAAGPAGKAGPPGGSRGEEPGWPGRSEHRALARRIAAEAVTVVRDEAGFLPLGSSGGLAVVDAFRAAPAPVEEPSAPRPSLGAALAARLPGVAAWALAPDGSNLEDLLTRLRNKDRVVVATADAGRHPEQVELVRRLLALDRPVAVVALASPYDLRSFPDVPTYLVTYGSAQPSIEGAVRILTGEAGAVGRLPVDLGV